MSKLIKFIAIVSFSAALFGASVEISEPFEGIRHYHRTTTVPRLLDMHLIEIDLKHPDIQFKVTPPNNPPENRVQRVRDFLTAEQNGDPSAKIAINASFYAFDTDHPYPYCWNRGLVASMGVPYSPWQSSDSGDNSRPWPCLTSPKTTPYPFSSEHPTSQALTAQCLQQGCIMQ